MASIIVNIPAGIDIYVGGALVVGQFILPNGSVTDDKVLAGANLSAAKLEHQHQQPVPLSNHATSVIAQRVPCHKAKAVGSVIDFRVDCTVPPTSGSSCTVDLKKNGASVLAAPVTIDDTAVANTAIVATLASAAYVAGERFDVEVSGITGTTAKGVSAWPTFREKAQ